jgi:hypothetical protein
VGPVVGAGVGFAVGSWVGCLVGLTEGFTDGSTEGLSDGFSDGLCVGASEGPSVGALLGAFVGAPDGYGVGPTVGALEGFTVGSCVGTHVEGNGDGTSLGCQVEGNGEGGSVIGDCGGAGRHKWRTRERAEVAREQSRRSADTCKNNVHTITRNYEQASNRSSGSCQATERATLPAEMGKVLASARWRFERAHSPHRRLLQARGSHRCRGRSPGSTPAAPAQRASLLYAALKT